MIFCHVPRICNDKRAIHQRNAPQGPQIGGRQAATVDVDPIYKFLHHLDKAHRSWLLSITSYYICMVLMVYGCLWMFVDVYGCLCLKNMYHMFYMLCIT